MNDQSKASREDPQPKEGMTNEARRLASLESISRIADQSLSLAEVMDIAFREIVGAISPDLLLFLQRSNGELPILFVYPPDLSPLFEGTRMHKVGKCLCGLAQSEGKTVYSGNIHRDPRCTLEECKSAGFSSFVALPLCSPSGIVGVLGIGSVNESDLLEEAEYLESLSTLLGKAVQDSMSSQGPQAQVSE